MVRTLNIAWSYVRAHAWLVVTVILFTLAAAQATATSQFCGLAEGVQREHVRTLERTYDYLAALETKDLNSTLTRFALANLPNAEAEARHDAAPAICDHLGLGLPEPDDPVPARPERVDRLFKKFGGTPVGMVQTK
jgi:hypothetical protein